MRVYELAKSLNLDSKRLIALMKRLQIDVKNHMSTLDDETIKKIQEIVEGKVHQPAKEPDKPSGGSPVGGTPPPAKKEPTRERVGPISPPSPGSPVGPRPSGFQPASGFAPPSMNRPAAARSSFVPPGAARPQGGPVPSRFEGQNRARTGPEPSQPGAAPDQARLGFEPPGRPSGGRRQARDERPSRRDRENLKGLGRPGPRRRAAPQPAPRTDRTIVLEGPATVSGLSQKFGIPASDIIKQLMNLDILATINQEIDVDTAEILAAEFGLKTEVKALKEDLDEALLVEIPDAPEDLKERPPVVTVMGHVDHGKTSLLDALRETRVTAQEAGGITQHIGAYSVSLRGRRVVFLDTPGHEAFTSMRARGAQLTDIAVLVVAADDGVMPQTIEAVSHARAAGVPIVVAINKIDKGDANPDRVKQQLAEHGLVAEEWGGDAVMVPVSARTREGLDHLLEMILLVADVRELRANPDKLGRGVVIEARLDRGRGPVATVLVQNGSVRVGDSFIVGQVFGKVRALLDDKGRPVKKAGPAMPVEILGLSEVPDAGDGFVVVEDERLARQVAGQRAERTRRLEARGSATTTLADLYEKIKEGEVQELRLILKGDVHGSVEPLKESLQRLSTDQVKVNVLHDGVGGITESDVDLASASQAIIIGFNVRPDVGAKRLADQDGVDIRTYRVIYDVLNDVELAMKGLLAPEYREVVVGHAEVRQVIRVPKVGSIAGLYVMDGKMVRSATIRILRNGAIVYEGKVDALKRFKDDVREVATGMECGLSLEKFQDFKEGDVFEAITMEEVPVT